MSEALVPFDSDDESDEREAGFRLQRAAILAVLKQTGIRSGDAHIVFERIERAIDEAVQYSAPSGSMSSEAMMIGFAAFLKER